MPKTSITVPAWTVVARLREFDLARRRANGQLREVVVRQIRAGIDPTRADLAAALREPPPDAALTFREPLTEAEEADLLRNPPKDVAAWLRRTISAERRNAAIARTRKKIERDTADLCNYVAAKYVLKTPRKSGRKHEDFTVTKALKLASAYRAAENKNRTRRSPLLATRLKADVARDHGVSVRALERVLTLLFAKNAPD